MEVKLTFCMIEVNVLNFLKHYNVILNLDCVSVFVSFKVIIAVICCYV